MKCTAESAVVRNLPDALLSFEVLPYLNPVELSRFRVSKHLQLRVKCKLLPASFTNCHLHVEWSPLFRNLVLTLSSFSKM